MGFELLGVQDFVHDDDDQLFGFWVLVWWWVVWVLGVLGCRLNWQFGGEWCVWTAQRWWVACRLGCGFFLGLVSGSGLLGVDLVSGGGLLGVGLVTSGGGQ